jgi:hypothetical protein
MLHHDQPVELAGMIEESDLLTHTAVNTSSAACGAVAVAFAGCGQSFSIIRIIQGR